MRGNRDTGRIKFSTGRAFKLDKCSSQNLDQLPTGLARSSKPNSRSQYVQNSISGAQPTFPRDEKSFMKVRSSPRLLFPSSFLVDQLASFILDVSVHFSFALVLYHSDFLFRNSILLSERTSTRPVLLYARACLTTLTSSRYKRELR